MTCGTTLAIHTHKKKKNQTSPIGPEIIFVRPPNFFLRKI